MFIHHLSQAVKVSQAAADILLRERFILVLWGKSFDKYLCFQLAFSTPASSQDPCAKSALSYIPVYFNNQYHIPVPYSHFGKL